MAGETRREFLLLLAAVGLMPATAAAGSPELAVIVHPGVGVSRLDDTELEAIFLTLRRFWSGSKAIIAFNLPPKSGPRVEFDRRVLRMEPDQVAQYWIDRRMRSGAPPPRQAPDPGVLVRVIAKLEGSIGYVPRSLVSGDVKIVAMVREGKVLPP